MFNVSTPYRDPVSGETKMDILIHREDDGCFWVDLFDINDNPIIDMKDNRVEMWIYDRERQYHPLIVLPMENEAMEIHLSGKETRQFYYDHEYYYTLVFITGDGRRYTFCSGAIELISTEGRVDYGCCETENQRDCGLKGRTQYW